MHELDGKLFFSASDLVRFMACPHAIYLDLRDREDPLGKAEDEEQVVLLQEKGFEHESAHLEKLRSKGVSIIQIEAEGSANEKAERTRLALQSGPDVIYQATLVHGSWHGYADFLVRTDRPSCLGPYSYEVHDTKLAKNPQPRHVIQLCTYSDLLGHEQGSMPQKMSLILGDGREAYFSFSDYAYYFQNARSRFEAFVENPPTSCYPEPCSYCGLCKWRNICQEKWETDEHLSLVANIRRSQIKKLQEAGVTSVRQLARLKASALIPQLNPDVVKRLRSQARLQIHKLDHGEDRFELLPGESGRGFERLPKPHHGDIFFDMEGDPIHPDGLEYLFGLYGMEAGKAFFKAIWAHDHEQERRAFEEVMDFFTNCLSKHPEAHIYHYNHYEETALKKLASRYGTRENALDDLLRRRKFVDLFKVVREGIRISEPGYSLKNVETFYMERREDDVQTAGESILFYERWRRSQDPSLLQQIADYNEADCRSTHLLRDWLLSLRPSDTIWFDYSSRAPDEERQQRHADAETRRTTIEERLLQNCQEAEVPFRRLVADLLEFHRREAKPQWWAMFNRQGQSAEELVEDPESLGGLEQDPDMKPYAEKRSMVFSYRFPAQDYKLGIGDRYLLSDSLEAAGEIIHLDPDSRRVSLKRGSRYGELPVTLSLIPTGPIDHRVLTAALYRFADALIEDPKRYPAVRALLEKALPRISGVRSGMPVIPVGQEILPAAIEAVANLKDSYLFIQGPPGSGKTYTSSQIIVELIRRGRKVGVASNSHKAIHRLLDEIVKTAGRRKIRFRGIKKATSGREDTYFPGEMFENVTENGAVDPVADVIAGTAWLFSREEFDQCVDYLFIDEAGQVSLANVLAMGLSARNIVLVGDQMQLGQPIQGVHPGDSGLSVLEYLLEETATIPPERGVFLHTTWRMHEDVCRFISEAVYDGRLLSEARTKKQRLLLQENVHPMLRATGIRFVPVEHAGCSQKSEEEAAVVAELYESLMRQKFQNAGGKIQDVTSENILVVSPYNMQVNHLKSVLPPESRVGTVDKFQGQEAEVVVVSMTTSSEEDLPRNIEFLYSKNRLNVAVSRAKALALIVASPRLLEIPCRTIEQMELVNTLCWARHYSMNEESRVS